MSYDDRQIEKPLTICRTCGHAYYMAHELCAWCGEGWRRVQVPDSRIRKTDVSGNLMTGP